MPLRKLLLRIMLIGLGVTAVAGAMAALTGGSDVGWRIGGTALATAIAAGLMIPFSLLADRRKTVIVGLLGMALVAVEFVATVALIWEMIDLIGGNRLSENVAESMLFLALVGIPTLGLLWLGLRESTRIAGLAGVAIGIAVFVLLMIGVWTGGGLFGSDDWFGTAAAVGSLGLLGAGCLAGLGMPPRRMWRWIGVAASAVAMTTAIYGIWAHPTGGERFMIAVVSVAVIVCHANLCLTVLLEGWQRWIRIITIAAALVTAVMVNLLATDSRSFAIAGNLAAAAGIIAACGSLALIVLASVNRRVERHEALSEIKSLTVVCPGCQRKQSLNVGDSRCGTCGLLFSIKIVEPRCAKCDYLLYMLQTDRCPECGTPVPSPARGMAAAGADAIGSSV